MNKKQKESKRKKVCAIQKRKKEQNLKLEQIRLQRKCREVFGKKEERLKKDGMGIMASGEIFCLKNNMSDAKGGSMAKFRNVYKRRLRETPAQRRKRNFWEAGVILEYRTKMTLAKYGYGIKPAAQPRTKQANFDALEEYYSAHPITTTRPSAVPAPMRRMCALDPPPVTLDADDIQPLGAAPVDGNLLVEYFSLIFFRLSRWFRGLWIAARFTHPAAWLLVSRHRARPS